MGPHTNMLTCLAAQVSGQDREARSVKQEAVASLIIQIGYWSPCSLGLMICHLDFWRLHLDFT
jgi:hypothetical protein